jgi:uncharacterized protein YecT (DUF1311 family)
MDRTRILAVLLAAGLASSAVSASAEPSFDCATAKTFREKAVCRDQRLARFDVDMAKAYAGAVARLDPAAAAALRKDQHDFLEGIDAGFEYQLGFGRGAEATESDLKGALKAHGGPIAGLEDEMKQRSEFLRSLDPGRKVPVGHWQNATTRVSVTTRQGALIVGFEAGTFGWTRYNCEFEAQIAPHGRELVADTARNLDIDTDYHNRLTFRQHGAVFELHETAASEQEFNGWTCPHRPELNEVLLPVR